MTQYFVINMEAFPPGWTNSQRYNGYHAVKNSVGKQSASQPWQITATRPNKPTVFDEDDNIIETGQTATMVLYSGDFTEDDLQRANIVAIIADELQVNPTAVDNKIEYEIMTHEQVLAMLHDNAAEWGESEGL